MSDVREILIYISNVINNLLHDWTLTKIIFSHFVGTGGVLGILIVIQNKHKAH